MRAAGNPAAREIKNQSGLSMADPGCAFDQRNRGDVYPPRTDRAHFPDGFSHTDLPISMTP